MRPLAPVRPVHPLRLASLAASPYAEAKGTKIPPYARNDMGPFHAGFVMVSDPRPKHTLSHLSIFGEQIQPPVRLLFSDLRKSHGEQKND